MVDNATTCLDRPDCFAYEGRQFDEDGGCWRALEFTECVADRMCGGAVTYAPGPGGTCWEFPSTCLPDGWEEALCEDMADAPPCP